MPMAEVALAAGFGSVRRFNETFQRLYARPPSALRRKTVDRKSAERGVSVRLRYRPPYDWNALLGFFRARAVEGVERVDAERYARTLCHEGELGTLEIRHVPSDRALVATIRFPNVRALPAIVARIRRQFDLAADLVTIGARLAEDPWLAPLVAARPGLRSAGAWDGFELGVRAILGQQVSVVAARRLNAELVRSCNRRVPGEAAGPGLTLVFPSPDDVLAADLSRLPVPGARRRALVHLAEAVRADPALFEPRPTIDETVARLTAVTGIGEWTAQYIALRAARDPDAFPASDLGLQRAAALELGERPSAKVLLGHAERWRPFRAYAAEHLWAADAAGEQKAP
jgi:AraC family transcriptional regulator of adaptative response / DNA-3-methyladenine glycosylase II